MLSDICFFNNKQGKISLYPSLDYLSNVIEESTVQTASLRGIRQLSIIRREEGNYKQINVIYNYRYSTSTDSFGVCLVIKDYYPCGVSYLFSFIGKIIAEIVNEGKVLYLDNKGFVQVSKDDIVKFSAVLQQHIDYSKKEFNENKAEFVKISSLSSNYYNIYKDQTIIHQLSDDSWNLTDSLNYNNIVIITEEIEDENINRMRSFIKKSNETVDDLNKKIKKLEEQLKKAEKEKKQLQTNPPKKQSNNTNGTGMDTTAWITLGVIGAIILLNVIAPWFIPTVWPKFAVALTVFGAFLGFKALNDDSGKKLWKMLGCVGAISILLSTVFTIYGICGGFSYSNDVAVQDGPIISNEQMNSIKKRYNTDVNENTQESLDIILKSPSVTMADLNRIDQNSLPQESKKRIQAIKHVYMHFIERNQNHKLKDLWNAYCARKTYFSPEQVEIMNWFFGLPKSDQKQWEQSSITAESFEDFQEKVKKMLKK